MLPVEEEEEEEEEMEGELFIDCLWWRCTGVIFIRGVDRSSFGPVDRSGPWVFVAVWSLGQALIGCRLKMHEAGAEQV